VDFFSRPQPAPIVLTGERKAGIFDKVDNEGAEASDFVGRFEEVTEMREEQGSALSPRQTYRLIEETVCDLVPASAAARWIASW
jgi:hypothetical protein